MPEPVKRCGTCKYLEIAPDAKGRLIPKKDRGYRCLWPQPTHSWPLSVSRAYGWREPGAMRERTYVAHTDGADCPEWVKRDA